MTMTAQPPLQNFQSWPEDFGARLEKLKLLSGLTWRQMARALGSDRPGHPVVAAGQAPALRRQNVGPSSNLPAKFPAGSRYFFSEPRRVGIGGLR